MIKVLFICHGNICRSVSAQYILDYIIKENNKEGYIYCDSAATSTEEIGNSIYPPMKKALENHSIPIGNHRARQLKKTDYDKYDLIIGMDRENMYYIDRILGEDPEGKVHTLMEYTDTPTALIDDPWYTRNFERAYEEIRRGCQALYESIIGS